MAVEIERKFLVRPFCLPKLVKGKRIEQFYPSNPCVRVRIVGKRYRAFLTIKGPGLLSRPKFEYQIPVRDAVDMIAMGSKPIVKTRYKVRHEGHAWDVDMFEGALDGLWLAEIKLKSEDEPFVMLPGAIKEVTHDPTYSNAYMSEHGMPPGTTLYF
jgi:adenylate cyclase